MRPDFKGLPAGQGSVHQGELLWEARCASCHGTFAEASHVFTPIAGGVAAQDLKTGRVASLLPGANQPNRTTLMKLSTLSTLWDYINRAMPLNAPKTLTADEVYAATAYILYLGCPAKPDVQGSACMRNCKTEVVITSVLPEHARNAHGYLADQSRLVGASRGADTRQLSIAANAQPNTAAAQTQRAQAAPEKGAPAGLLAGAGVAAAAQAPRVAIEPPPQSGACAACHSMDIKLLGPSFKDIASKYKDRPDAVNYLSGKIRAGGQGVWGAMAMPAQALSEEQSLQLAAWLMQSPLAAGDR
ncbi:c-type cytochrome [Polaromonas sp.]|uniref:c-type cytochrome n=1 Tax=Polaromonas sp. TaxID=1869339 RepID=UPI0025F80D1A|nr:c-type cytochrome [Polaromonas sp.]